MRRIKELKKFNFIIFPILLMALLSMPCQSEAAVRRVSVGESINKAIKAAKPGDTIEITPGIYRESIKITRNDLSFVAAGERHPAPLEDIFAPDSGRDVVITGGAILLTDSNNTLWRGICFMGGKDTLKVASLKNFTGRFENCRFGFEDYDETVKGSNSLLTIEGGTPTFHASVFANQQSSESAVFITDVAPTNGKTAATFTYCVFQDLKGGVVEIDKDAHGLFQNCLFQRNHTVVKRKTAASIGGVQMDNCVFYLNSNSPNEFAAQPSGTPPVNLRNCVLTPGFPHNRFPPYHLAPKDFPGTTVNDCRTDSPRFLKGRREAVINFGVDDTRTLEFWAELCGIADVYRYPVTLSLNTWAAETAEQKQQIWDMLKRGIDKGHEVGAHSSSHAPLTTTESLLLKHYRPTITSATLDIDEDSILRIVENGKSVIVEINLKEKELRLGQLATILNKSGVDATLTEPYFRDVPTRFLLRQKNLDILFENFSIPLAMDQESYVKYECNNSRQSLIDNLPGASGRVFIYPHGVYNQNIMSIVAAAGFEVARAGQQTELSPYMKFGINPFAIWGISAFNVIGKDISTSETRRKFLMLIDYFKDLGGWGTFYSHTDSELTLKAWETIFKTTQEDGDMRVVTLAGMLDSLKKQSVPDNEGNYKIPVGRDQSDYHPRPDSPLIRAGIDVGLTSDFEGKLIPKGAKPNIGIYE